MVEIKISDWLKADEFPKSNELQGQFYDEGSFVKMKQKDGSEKEVFDIGVQFSTEDGKVAQRRWTPNKTSLKSLVGLYGKETSKWVGKPFELFINQENVQGTMRKVIYARGDSDD